jgi:threonine/homoserine efflux transporter RhtA
MGYTPYTDILRLPRPETITTEWKMTIGCAVCFMRWLINSVQLAGIATISAPMKQIQHQSDNVGAISPMPSGCVWER